ncbi:hypothetical protein [Sphingobium nicotianae]|uniref:Uncharacterized protein n=1 Tax=Sphingobium nicotianae TaxID=2782607 RepID=A0A9X1AIC7_9SPHN|nr:hypothetical protein [Sphingobium nicotianae]MBT2185847.1 hypothetical protein [Sphingobium nicotianae]
MRDERQYVIVMITAFLNGFGSRTDWDDFTSGPLRDAELNRIRQCALAIELPLDADGRAVLKELLAQAELVPHAEPEGPKPWRLEIGLLAGLLVGAALWWANYLPGAGLFDNLPLLVVPPALGALVVVLRNSRKKVGVHDPRIIAQNEQGRV